MAKKKEEFVIGDKYVHYKNGNLYEILDPDFAMQVNQVWVPAIAYKDLGIIPPGHSAKCVRSVEEFREKFIKFKKSTWNPK